MKVNSISFLFVIFSFTLAEACDCKGTPSLANAYKSSTLVFRGKIKKIMPNYLYERKASSKGRNEQSCSSFKVLVEVEEVFKGSTQVKTVEILTGVGTADCGYPFQEGKVYLIYASMDSRWSLDQTQKGVKENKAHLEVTSCGRTKLLTDSQEELSQLRRMHK